MTTDGRYLYIFVSAINGGMFKVISFSAYLAG